MSDKWLWMSATDLGRAIGAGEIDPVTLTETYLAAIHAHPEHARIYAHLTPDRARAEAAAASLRAKQRQRRSILDGVPISWKDLFDSAGTATEAGSALLAGRMPAKDAVVLRNATEAGLVCLGKTHMSELAFSGLGLNPVTATPPCVNDPDAVPGGSSSGAAASVAFGLAACGIGSDTGGSVRIPSAWNDLVGLKTTPGTLSNQGVVPLCAFFDTVGPLCRTVEDANHTLSAMSGRHAADLRGASLEGRRFLVLDGTAQHDMADRVADGFHSAVARLKAAGAAVDHASIEEIDAALGMSAVLFTPEAYGTWRETIEAAPHKMYKAILDRFRSGADFSAPDYISAHRKLDDLRRGYAHKTAAYEGVLCATSPILPPNAQRLLDDDAYYVRQNLLALRNTRIGNLMGVPGLSMPTGTPSVGLQILGHAGGELQLLRIGAAVETALS